MITEPIKKLADALMHEGYVLYPYRASSLKNRYRWTFGVLAPRTWSETGGCERWWLESQLLIEGTGELQLGGAFRCMHVEKRELELGDIDACDELHVPFEEGRVVEVPCAQTIAEDGGEWMATFVLAKHEEEEAINDRYGRPIGRVLRRRAPLTGRMAMKAVRLPSEPRLVHVSLRVENVTPWEDEGATREQVLASSFVASHLILTVEGRAFVSLLDPPEWAAEAARACASMAAHPVLVGPADARDVVLASPFILPDHPQLAPESGGDFYDATEIDELLTLRTLTLTDREKREARATDPRARAILERVEATSKEAMEQMHGTLRDWVDEEMAPRALPEPRFMQGSRVRLRPGARRTDAQDLLFAGCIATVEKTVFDIDGSELVAVTIDEDPAAELHRWYGRFHYYRIDEVEAA